MHAISPNSRRALSTFALLLAAGLAASGAPTANPNSYESLEDNTLTVDVAGGVLTNDVPESGALSAILVGDVSNGSLDLNGDGSFSYSPGENFNGVDSFTYVAAETPNTLIFTVDRSRSNVDFSATISAAGITQARSDNSSLTGTLDVRLQPPGAPFDGVHVIDASLVVADDIALNYGVFLLLDVRVTANGGEIMLNMSEPGLATTADGAGAFSQLMNDFALTGDANVDVRTDNLGLGIPDGPQAIDTVLQDIDLNGILTQSGGTITLTLPVTFQGTFDLSGNDAIIDIEGTVVATAPVPTLSQSAPALVTLEIDPANDAPLVIEDSYYVFDGQVLTVPAGAAGEEVLVAEGANWRYLDDGSDAGTAWREPDFDDALWASGAAKLGYGDDGEVTVVGFGGDPDNKPITTYFRHGFELADPDQTSALTLRLMRDDGAGVFLNGTEVLLDNLPAGAGFDTLASATVGDADETAFFEYLIDPAALVAGSNVLAVEVHQADAGSSDLGFDLELRRTKAAGVLANDSDIDGDAVTATEATPPAHGTLALAADGSFVYTPEPGFTGADPFIYSVANGGGKELLELVTADAEWRYLDDGSDQGTAWQAPGFDDAAWAVGEAELGYGEGDEATEVSFGGDEANKFVTTYFRHRFTVGDHAAASSLIFTLLRDDAAAIYLNGVEVFRDANLAAGAAFNTLATSAVDEGEAEIVISIPTSDLVEGENVIAVEVHQSALNSSDLSFALTARATLPPAAVVVRRGDGWRYLDDGSDQGGAWRDAGFDDGAWASGSAPLGYGEDEVTTLSFGDDPDNKFATSYFRRSFEMIGADGVSAAVLRLRRDDGAAVYLNGVEIARDNLAPGAGAADLATATVGGDDEGKFFDYPFDPGLLIEGANVLAAEVHQSGAASSDLIFDAELAVSVSEILRRAQVTVASAGAGDIDSDNDGISDSYEVANGLTVGVDDSGGDLDGDGQNNIAEFMAGTSANDPGSVLRTTEVAALPGGDLELTVATVPGKTYQLETSLNGEVWTPVAGSEWIAAGTVETVAATSEGDLRLWRVVVLP